MRRPIFYPLVFWIATVLWPKLLLAVPGSSAEPMPSTSVEKVREAFNAHSDSVRLVTILSPVCPGCRHGHRVVKKLFGEISSPNLKGFIVFLPMVTGDSASAASKQAKEFSDSRIALQGWDPDRDVANLFSQTLKLKVPTWDVYLVYAPGVKWDGKTPPTPTYWMHQLREKNGAPPALFLKPEVLTAEIQELLEKRL